MVRFEGRRAASFISTALLLSGCIQGLNVGGSSSSGSGGQAGTGAQAGSGTGGTAAGGQAGSGAGGQAGSGTGGQAGSGAGGIATGGTGGQAGGDTGGAALTGWSKNFGGDPGAMVPSAWTVDAQHNLYIAGGLYGSVDLGHGPITGEMFVMEVDITGNLVWARGYDADGSVTGLGVDGMGNVFLAGDTDHYVDFGGGKLWTSAPGDYDVWVAKLDPVGNHVWSKLYGDAQGQGTFGSSVFLGVDGAGDVVVSGPFEGTIDFGDGPLTSLGSDFFVDLFLVKLDTNGAPKQKRRIGPPAGGATGTLLNQHLAIDASNDVLIVGQFGGTVDFGGPAPMQTEKSDAPFFAKYDPQGNLLWQRTYGVDTAGVSVHGFGMSSDGKIVVCDWFGGDVDFGGGLLQSDTQTGAMYYLQLDANGNHVASKKFAVGALEITTAAAVEPDGSASVVGSYQSKLDLGDIGGPQLMAANFYGAIVLRFEPDGQLDTAHTHSYDVFNQPAFRFAHADGLGGTYVSGHFVDTIDVGFGSMAAASQEDALAIHYVP